jgi:hypothetical protein
MDRFLYCLTGCPISQMLWRHVWWKISFKWYVRKWSWCTLWCYINKIICLDRRRQTHKTPPNWVNAAPSEYETRVPTLEHYALWIVIGLYCVFSAVKCKRWTSCRESLSAPHPLTYIFKLRSSKLFVLFSSQFYLCLRVKRVAIIYWIKLARYTHHLWPFVNTAMTLWFRKPRNLLSSLTVVAWLQKDFCAMDFLQEVTLHLFKLCVSRFVLLQISNRKIVLACFFPSTKDI